MCSRFIHSLPPVLTWWRSPSPSASEPLLPGSMNETHEPCRQIAQRSTKHWFLPGKLFITDPHVNYLMNTIISSTQVCAPCLTSGSQSHCWLLFKPLDTRKYSEDLLIPYAASGGPFTPTPFYPHNNAPAIPSHHRPTFLSDRCDSSLSPTTPMGSP